jgi:hypothetical protein
MALVLPMSALLVIAAYDSGLSSFPVPMAIAVASRSVMVVVWIAPRVIVHEGSHEVDSS